VILGCRTNLEFLRAVIRHDAFRRGETTTRFLERHFHGWSGDTHDPALAIGAVLAVLQPGGGRAHPPAGQRRADPWDELGPWRLGGARE